jgi:tetratricopeptide (TPR) repeat protein
MLRTLGRTLRARPLISGLVVALVLAAGAAGAVYGYVWHKWQTAQLDLREGRWEDARAGLEVCLTVWPSSPEVHRMAARAARMCGDIADAEAHLKQCIRLENGASEATQLEFLLMRVQTGDEEEVAPKLFQLVDRGQPQAELILETVARAYMHRLRYGPAYAALTRWIKAFPNAAKPYHWRGWVLERMDQHREGMKDYLKALEREPDLVPVRLRVAEMLLEDNQTLQALPYLEKLRRDYPERPDIMAKLGVCRLAQGKVEEARKLLEDAAARLPNDPWVLLNLGKLENQSDRPVEAEHWLRRALKADPSDTEVQFNLAESLKSQGRVAEHDEMMARCNEEKALLKQANQLLQDEAKHPSNDPAAPAKLGALLLGVGQERLGLYWLDQALQRNPKYQPAHRALAEYFEKKGNRQRAAFHRQKLAELEVRSPPP